MNLYNRPQTTNNNQRRTYYNHQGNNNDNNNNNNNNRSATNRPQSAGVTRRTVPSGLKTKHKIDRLQNMLSKSRNSFSNGNQYAMNGNNHQQIHGISVNSRNHRVAKLRKDIKLVESYVLRGRNSMTTQDDRDRKFIEDHSYLYRNNRSLETKSGYPLTLGEAQFIHPNQQVQRNANNSNNNNNNMLEDKFLSPWDDNTGKDNLDQTGMLHIPTSSAQWQTGTGSPPRSFAAKYDDGSGDGDDRYQNDFVDAAKRAKEEANEMTAFKSEIERKTSLKKLNNKNFKVTKGDMSISATPLKSMCRDESSKEFVKNATEFNSMPRYPGVVHNTTTNNNNNNNRKADINNNIIMTKEASVTTFLQVKKLKQDDQLSSKTYQSSSRGQWSTTYNYGDSKNDEDNNMIYSSSRSSRNTKGRPMSAGVFRRSNIDSSISPPFPPHAQIISIDTRTIKKKQNRRDYYATVNAQKLHVDKKNGINSTSVPHRWKTRPMSASLRRHKLIGEKATRRVRKNANTKFRIAVDGSKHGIFNNRQHQPTIKVNTRFQSRVVRPKSASRATRRNRRANTSIGENVGGPNIHLSSTRASHSRRPHTASVRRRNDRDASLNLFIVSSTRAR